MKLCMIELVAKMYDKYYMLMESDIKIDNGQNALYKLLPF